MLFPQTCSLEKEKAVYRQCKRRNRRILPALAAAPEKEKTAEQLCVSKSAASSSTTSRHPW